MAKAATRRAVLRGLAVAPAIGLAGAVPFVAAASANAAAWYRLKARYDAFLAYVQAWERDIFDPAYDEFARHVKRPDLSFTIKAANGAEQTFYVYPPKFETVPIGPFEREAARIRAEWEAFKVAEAIWEPRLNINALCERSDRLWRIEVEMRQRLIKLPAPDLGALLWKLNGIWGLEPDQDYSDSITAEWIRPVMADAQRLLGGEALS